MEDQVLRLADKVWDKYQALPDGQRLRSHWHRRHPGLRQDDARANHIVPHQRARLILILQRLLVLVLVLLGRAPPPATYVPMDGFHLTRATLSSMPDPTHAHARRGAAFTFDAPKFLALVQRLRASPPPASPILAPSFDHAVKDPRDDDIPVLASHRVVVLEGNYLALDEPVWRDAAALLDELWFVDVDFQVARRRLRQRHVRAGIARDLDEGTAALPRTTSSMGSRLSATG
ncbi:hypothetical protein ACCO45_000328 [Purpureocillium lilacinum]|uniref:Uncharacterized protein n=1 Tax=Purpureocillium lilacinum TaxID=33203 RepID=A0ACC4E5C0_PURLI